MLLGQEVLVMFMQSFNACKAELSPCTDTRSAVLYTNASLWLILQPAKLHWCTKTQGNGCKPVLPQPILPAVKEMPGMSAVTQHHTDVCALVAHETARRTKCGKCKHQEEATRLETAV